MKSFAVLAVLAATVAAQSPEDILNTMPKCALACIQEAAAAEGCATGDFACECENMEKVTAAATKCQLALDDDKKCTGAELASAIKVGGELCVAVAAGGDSGDSTASTTATDDAKPTESKTDGDAEATTTASDGDAEATATASDGGDEATATEDGPEASGDSDSGSDDSGSDDAAGDDGNAGTKLGGFAWAGVAAAAVAYIF